MSLAEIRAHVQRQRQRIAQARRAAAALGRLRIEQRIEPSLGVVVVNVWGELLEVRLDRAGLRIANPRTVDQRVLRAIHAAEARASQIIDDHVRRWS